MSDQRMFCVHEPEGGCLNLVSILVPHYKKCSLTYARLLISEQHRVQTDFKARVK